MQSTNKGETTAITGTEKSPIGVVNALLADPALADEIYWQIIK
jgi:hypothetical protein